MPLLYEINARCWLAELSRQAGAPVMLATVPQREFDQWREAGISHVWLMGVWTSGPRSRAKALEVPEFREGVAESDIGGSPYAIAAYEVPLTLGGEEGLREFRRRLNQHGIGLVLDFVPNHVGLDHPWLTRHPEYFVRGNAPFPGAFLQETEVGPQWIAHGRDPFFPPWSDTAQIDYRVPAARKAMMQVLLGVAARCDGVRCDMAMLVLNEVFSKTWAEKLSFENPEASRGEFWSNAIAAVKLQHPDFLFLAEVYWGREIQLQALGFDYTYQKELYDDLVRRNVDGLLERLKRTPPSILERGIFFLENHDEPRIASLLSLEEHRAAALFWLSLPGMRFLHEGQWVGARRLVPVQWLRCPVEDDQDEIVRLYRETLSVNAEAGVGQGEWRLLEPEIEKAGGRSFPVMEWRRAGGHAALIAVNLRPEPARGSVVLPGGLESGRARELLRSESGGLGRWEVRSERVFWDLPAHGRSVVCWRAAAI